MTRCAFAISVFLLFGIHNVLTLSGDILLTLKYQHENGEILVNFNETMLRQFLICLCDETIPECQASANKSEGEHYFVHYTRITLHDKNVTNYRNNLKCEGFLSQVYLFNISCSSTNYTCWNKRNRIHLKATWKTRDKFLNKCLAAGSHIFLSENLTVAVYNTSLLNITGKCHRKGNKSHSTNEDKNESSTNVTLNTLEPYPQQTIVNKTILLDFSPEKSTEKTDFVAEDNLETSGRSVVDISTPTPSDATSTILIAIFTPTLIGVVIMLVIVAVRRKKRALRSARRYSLPRLNSVEDSNAIHK